jgi:outer membrane protein assembly factor BamB
VLLIAGGGIGYFVLTSGSHSGSGGTKAAVPSDALQAAWKSKPLPRATRSHNIGMPWPGHWTYRRTLVYGDENGVRGYDMENGHQKWKVEPPKGAGEPCAMSSASSPDGLGVVVFDAGGDECSFLAAVDLDSGRVAWSKKLLTEYGENGPQVYVGSTYVSVALNTVEGMQTFDVRTGAAADPFASSGIGCRFRFVFSAQYIVAKPECKDEMIVLDTQYGAEPVSIPHQKGKPVKILSDSPLRIVVTTGEDDDGPRQLLTFTDDEDGFETMTLTGTLADVVFDDVGSAVTEDGLYFCHLNNGYDAVVDLDDGKEIWKAKDPRTSFIGYHSTSRRLLIAVPSAGEGYWTAVGALDPDTGKLTQVGTMVLPDGTYLMQNETLFAYDSGKVMAVGPRSDGKRLVAAFTLDLPAGG